MMKVQVTMSPPTNTKPLETYETTFVYTGLSRLDTKKKKIVQIQPGDENHLLIQEVPWEGTILSRSYHTENVRVTVYSTKPHAWSETLDPRTTYFFSEVPSVISQ